MATEIVVPTLGESVTTATVARWMKQQGEAVAADEPLVELETDKVTVEVNAPAAGVLSSIAVPEGTEVEVGAVAGWCGAMRPAPTRRAPKPGRSSAVRRSRGCLAGGNPPAGVVRRRGRWVRCRGRRRPSRRMRRCPRRRR